MAEDAILKGRVTKRYRANIDFRTARESMPELEAEYIAAYLYQRFSGSSVISSWSKKIINWRGIDKGLDVKVRTFIHSDAPFTLGFDASIKYPESSAKRAEEVMSALAAYNYHSMRGH